MEAEQLFSQFDKKYSYSYLAQEDGGNKSVIFSFYPKGMYERPKETWIDEVRFETDTLEQAFKAAFYYAGLSHERVLTSRFNVENWSKIDRITKYYSIGDKRWKDVPKEEMVN